MLFAQTRSTVDGDETLKDSLAVKTRVIYYILKKKKKRKLSSLMDDTYRPAKFQRKSSERGGRFARDFDVLHVNGSQKNRIDGIRLFCSRKGTTSSSALDVEDAGPDGAGGSRSPSTTSASVSPRPQPSQPSLGGVSTPPPTPIRAPPPPPSTVGGLGPPGER